MKMNISKRGRKLAAYFVIVGVFLCIGGSAMAASSHDRMNESASCQTMQINLIAPTSDGRLFGILGVMLFALFFIRTFKPDWGNFVQQTATALGPPRGSQWRLFQHVFLDSIYRQFSPARQYAAVVVEPQMYSA